MGIAALKSFVESNSDVSVRCLDLNIAFHRHFFKGDQTDRSHLISHFNQVYQKTNKEVKEKFKDRLWEIPFLQEMMDFIIATEPDIIGISVCFNQQFFYACALAKAIKERLGVRVIFGGSAVTSCTEKYESEFDVEVIEGDGGERLLSRISPDSGVTDQWPHPDYSDFDLKDYFSIEPVIPLQSSRGCYWGKCAFCVHHMTFDKYCQRPIADILSEIRMHNENGVEHFAFVDDMISSRRAKEIAQAIIKEGLRVFFQFETKPTKDFDRAVLDVLYEAGCRIIIWGLESGNQDTIDAMQKGLIVSDVPGILKESHETGIKNYVFMMYNFPTEDETGFQKTIKLLGDNRDYITFISKSEFGLVHGSPMIKEPERFGILDMVMQKRVFLPPVYKFTNHNKIARFGQYDMIINAINKKQFHLHYFMDHMLVEYGRDDQIK